MSDSRFKNFFICLAFMAAALVLAVPMCSYTEDLTLKILSVPFYQMKGMSLVQSSIEYDTEGLPYFIFTQCVYDKDGIPSYDYSNMIGIQRNPELVCMCALDYEKKYMEGNKSCKKLFFNCADWLERNGVQHDNYSLWELTFNLTYKAYNMSPPSWCSGMAQGHGLEILAKAYDITGDDRYLKNARMALNSFYVDADDGGFTYKDKDGWWYEEYADIGGSKPRVLNGMMYTLLGLYEYYSITGDTEAKSLFDKGIASLRNHLSDYDAGYWTYYDAYKRPAGKTYHHVHVMQLKRLYQITGDRVFLDYYNKWGRYESGPERFLYRFLLFRDKLSLLIYAINFSAICLFLLVHYYLPKRLCRITAKNG